MLFVFDIARAREHDVIDNFKTEMKNWGATNAAKVKLRVVSTGRSSRHQHNVVQTLLESGISLFKQIDELELVGMMAQTLQDVAVTLASDDSDDIPQLDHIKKLGIRELTDSPNAKQSKMISKQLKRTSLTDVIIDAAQTPAERDFIEDLRTALIPTRHILFKTSRDNYHRDHKYAKRESKIVHPKLPDSYRWSLTTTNSSTSSSSSSEAKSESKEEKIEIPPFTFEGQSLFDPAPQP